MSEIAAVAEKVFVFDGKLISINDKEITVNAEYIGGSLDIYARDLFRDIFFLHYQGQNIIINAQDGEPLRDLGVIEFISTLCNEFNIPKNSIKFVTHDDVDYPGFQKELKSLQIFWAVKKHTNLDVVLQQDAKFVGIAIGRMSPPRLRMMFRLNQEFHSDAFIICQNKPNFSDYPMAGVKHLYSDEIDWLEKYKFETDLSQYFTPWSDSCKSYHNIWGKYKIEVVCETHANSEYWFTEKTARCLITGKPFVLLAGPNTLARLQNMGFQTFGSVIDESYDQACSWPQRLEKIIHALKELKNQPDIDRAINQMYSIGKFNQQHYLNHV